MSKRVQLRARYLFGGTTRNNITGALFVSARAAQSRFSSSYAHLHDELTARRLPLAYDYLTPQPSHLLNVSLVDYLPSYSSSSPASTVRATQALPSIQHDPSVLPPSHHLVYFPPTIPGSQLLPDGTDPLQSPGPPFVRRMWGGGGVRFTNDQQNRLYLDGKRAVCVEGIRDVTIKGKEGDEKVFVGIERRVGRCGEDEGENSIRGRLWTDKEEDFGEAGAIERRNIVFMRERTPEQAKAAAQQPGKVLKPQHEPAYMHTLIPNPNLLFRYSALTFNAHSIHLDPSYCRDIEGHRNLVVHGPLSFTLMLTLLRFHLQHTYPSTSPSSSSPYLAVKDIEYRNVAPLYCGEPMKVCGRKAEVDENGVGKWEVWVETPEGGFAVRGSARTEMVQGQDGRGPRDLYQDLRMHFGSLRPDRILFGSMVGI